MDTITVIVYVTGVAIHTPVIPQIAGKTRVNIKSKTSPRNAEISAEAFASPQLVKYIELITLYPIMKKVTA